MHSLAEPTSSNAAVFTFQERHVFVNAVTTTQTEVFSRLERQVKPSYVPRHITFQAGGQKIALQYLDDGAGVPTWIEPVLNSLSERWGAGRGWDTYDAKPTNLHYVLELLNHLSNLLKPTSPAPTITPLADGGVQAEWHINDKDVEIVVAAEQPSRFYVYDAITQEEAEGLLESHDGAIQKIIADL